MNLMRRQKRNNFSAFLLFEKSIISKISTVIFPRGNAIDTGHCVKTRGGFDHRVQSPQK